MSEQGSKANAINREFEERQAQSLAERFSLGYVDIEREPVNPDYLDIIPRETALSLKIMPFRKNHKKIRVALVSPNSEAVQNYVQRLKKDYEVDIFICSESGFSKAAEIYEAEITNKKTVETRDDFEEHSSSSRINIEGFKVLEDKLPSLQTEVGLSEIILTGLEAGASDIHFQPYLDRMKLRFRINGILHDVLETDQKTAQRIVSRIKYDSGTKSNISDIPQDGRMSLNANDRQIDIRVSVIPTETVESITMRILDVRKGLRKFDELGFTPDKIADIKQVIREPDGMVLMTGPTGSGKTTTLYAMLNELNTPDQKIVTLEDPIEYHLPNVTQSQVDNKKEYNFASGLKAMLRHDPDIILIGEIREFDTARLALEASQTGHLVFSSLHANSAVASISRLRNLGIDNFNIASSIRAVFGQRLVRTLCPDCKKKVEAVFEPELQTLAANFEVTLPSKIYEPVGCDTCGQSGFTGRTTITEVMFVNHEVAKLITDNTPEHDIKKALIELKQCRPLVVDGLEKVIAGETSLTELLRVVSLRDL